MPMKSENRRSRMPGFTLIEMVVAIVILAIGASSFVLLINQSTIASVDPVIRQQAAAVGQSYLDEVLLRSFCDPDLSDDCRNYCDASRVSGSSICAQCSQNTGGSETRATYDDVCDYDGLANNGARDNTGSSIAGLSDYNVQVAVDDNTTLDGLSSSNGEVLRVDVSVSHDTYPDLNHRVTGYRTNY